MIIVFLDETDKQDVVLRLLDQMDVAAAPIIDEGGARYLLPNGVILTQSQAGLALSDDNWGNALHVLRELTLVARGQVAFMTDEDELVISLHRDSAPTPDPRLADFAVNTGPDLVRFASDITRVMQVAEDEMDTDPVDQAHIWAFDTSPNSQTSQDQLADFQITFVFPAPGHKNGGTLGAASLQQQRWFADGGQGIFAATGTGFYLLLDDITQESGTTFARGTLNVFYDPDVENEPERGRVLGIVKDLCSDAAPFIQIDIDRNAETAGAEGFWVVEVYLKDGDVHQTDNFWSN